MKVIAKDFTIPKQYLKQYQVLLSKSQTTIFSCKCCTQTQYVVFFTELSTPLGGERSILLSYRNICYIKFTYIFAFCQTKSGFLKVGFEKTFYHTAKSVDIFEKSDTITTEYPWGYGSVGRAMRSQRIGQGFESPRLHQKQAPS